jgi:hypothetical protein
MNQESTATRALKKDGNIYCAKCGNELDHLIVCRGCGFRFPDYFLVQVSKPVRRKAGKSDRSMSFALRPVSQTYAISSKPTGVSRKTILMVVGLLVVAALVAAGITVNHKMTLDKRYRRNFVLVLCGTKGGADMSLADCAKMSAEWKAKMDAGQTYVPRVSPEEAARLNKIKGKAEENNQKLNAPPEKYAPAYEKLTKLYGIYSNIHALTLAPSGSLAGFTDSTQKAESDFKLAAQELKEKLPADLAEDIKTAKTKYKELSGF